MTNFISNYFDPFNLNGLYIKPTLNEAEIGGTYIDNMGKCNDFACKKMDQFLSNSKNYTLISQFFQLQGNGNPLQISAKDRQGVWHLLSPRQAEAIWAIANLVNFLAAKRSKEKQYFLSPQIFHESIMQEIKDRYQVTHVNSSGIEGSPFKNLPLDILSPIFTHLEQKDISNLGQTCHHFDAVRQVYRGALKAELPYYHYSQEDLKAIPLAQSALIRQLHFYGGTFSPENLADFLQRCPHVRSISFEHCKFKNFDQYVTVVAAYIHQHLESIKIVNCKMSDEALYQLAAKCHHIHSFEFIDDKGEGQLSDWGMNAFFSRSLSLETIRLIGCPRLTYVPLCLLMQMTVESRIPPIYNQELIEPGPSKPGRIHKGHLIKEINFSYCGATSSILFEFIRSYCPYIQSQQFYLSKAQGLTELDSKQDEFKLMIEYSQHLKTLKLREIRYINEIIKFALDSVIEHLELSKCMNLNDSFFKHFECTSLKTFKFESLQPGTTLLYLKHFKKLSEQTDLEVLSLTNCAIDADGLYEYIAQSPGLKELELIYPWSALKIPLLLDLLAKHCPNLESLKIHLPDNSPQPLFDPRIIENLFQNCRSLKKLYLKLQALPQTNFQSLPPFLVNTPPVVNYDFGVPSSNTSNLNSKKMTSPSFPIQATSNPYSGIYPIEPAYVQNAGSPNGFDAEVLKVLASNAPQLTHLTLDHVTLEDEIETQHILQNFNESCPGLTQIGFLNSDISTSILTNLIEFYSPRLRSLNLHGTPLRNPQAILKSLKKCRRLHELNIKDSQLGEIFQPLIDDDGIPHLQKLVV